MPTFEVLEYERAKRWEGKYGEMIDHVLTVRDEMDQTHKSVILSQKPNTPAPTVGEMIQGILEPGQWGKKLKKEQLAFTGGKGGGSWKPRDPSEIAAIQRQHSQEMALRFASISPAVGKAMAQHDKASQTLTELIKPLVDWFQRDVNAGVALAAQDAKTAQVYGQRRDTQVTGGSDVPSDAPEHPSTGDAGTPWAA